MFARIAGIEVIFRLRLDNGGQNLKLHDMPTTELAESLGARIDARFLKRNLSTYGAVQMFGHVGAILSQVGRDVKCPVLRTVRFAL